MFSITVVPVPLLQFTHLAILDEGSFMSSLQKRQKAKCGSWKLSSIYEWKLKVLWLPFSLTHGWLWKTGLGDIFPTGRVLLNEHNHLICVEKEILWDKTIWRLTDSAQWLDSVLKLWWEAFQVFFLSSWLILHPNHLPDIQGDYVLALNFPESGIRQLGRTPMIRSQINYSN